MSGMVRSIEKRSKDRSMIKHLDSNADNVVGIIMVAFFGAGLLGYVMNLWKIAAAIGGTFDGQVILRIIGVMFPPLGAIVGWF